jgi:hypothetical protein
VWEVKLTPSEYRGVLVIDKYEWIRKDAEFRVCISGLGY